MIVPIVGVVVGAPVVIDNTGDGADQVNCCPVYPKYCPAVVGAPDTGTPDIWFALDACGVEVLVGMLAPIEAAAKATPAAATGAVSVAGAEAMILAAGANCEAVLATLETADVTGEAANTDPKPSIV